LRPLLVLDALLHVLIVEIELADAVIGAVLRVCSRAIMVLSAAFFFSGIDLVVCLLLWQVFLKLLHIGSPSAGGEKTQAMFSGLKVRDRRRVFRPAWF
jgi:hypothetical protein